MWEPGDITAAESNGLRNMSGQAVSWKQAGNFHIVLFVCESELSEFNAKFPNLTDRHVLVKCLKVIEVVQSRIPVTACQMSYQCHINIRCYHTPAP